MAKPSNPKLKRTRHKLSLGSTQNGPMRTHYYRTPISNSLTVKVTSGGRALITRASSTKGTRKSRLVDVSSYITKKGKHVGSYRRSR